MLRYRYARLWRMHLLLNPCHSFTGVFHHVFSVLDLSSCYDLIPWSSSHAVTHAVTTFLSSTYMRRRLHRLMIKDAGVVGSKSPILLFRKKIIFLRSRSYCLLRSNPVVFSARGYYICLEYINIAFSRLYRLFTKVPG